MSSIKTKPEKPVEKDSAHDTMDGMHIRQISYKLIGFVVIVCIGVVLAGTWYTRMKRPVISPIPDGQKNTASVFSRIFTKKKSPEDLRTKIQKIVDNRWKNYSVFVKDFNSDFMMGINETVIYTAASMNKVPIVAALYYFGGKGEIDLDERITIQAADIQDYGTGSIRYDPPGSVYSIKTLAKLMIGQSDNTAAYVLANYTVGLDKIQSLMNQWGVTQTDMVNNKTSNHDIALLFEKIYKGGVTNIASTQEMLAFFKNTDFEDRIPAPLPKPATVYHKIGSDIGAVHDAGVITDAKHAYYLGVFTSDITDEEEATTIIAAISKTTYEFLTQ